MTTALLAIGDGRLEYEVPALKSALRFLPRFDQYIFVDDSAHRLGFAGAVQAGWDQVQTDYVFHLELDFTFDTPVPVPDMLALLIAHPELLQVSLKRQAWSNEEKAAGGIVELHPDWFTTVEGDLATRTEHRVYFTTNPSVYRSGLCRLGWPQVPHSEGVFTAQLLRDGAARFAILGAKFDPPRTTHIGTERRGGKY